MLRERESANKVAALALHPGIVTPCGWRVSRVVDAFPWPYVLLVKGEALGRASPCMVFAALREGESTP